MRILALTTNLDKPEAFLIATLKSKGIDIELICDDRSPFQDIVLAAGVPIFHLRCNYRVDIKAVLSLRRIIIKSNFNIIHSFSSRTLTCVLFATIGLKCQHVTYRGTVGHISRFDPSSWLSFLNPKIAKIICVSNAVKSYLLKQGVPDYKLVTIYKGHDPVWYQKVPRDFLLEFGIPESAFVVVCTANMRSVKGVDVLVEAFQKYLVKEDFYLLLLGKVIDSNIKNIIEKSPDRICAVGFRSDAVAIVGGCSIFVMPSREREGLPKAVIEAMCQKVPVVVTNVGGLPELVRDGIDGVVVPPNNSEKLAQAILKLESDGKLKECFVLNAHRRILEDFSIEKTVEETLKVYRSLPTNGLTS
jgi:glycosyltransferase involved in cell wall biosynthesis